MEHFNTSVWETEIYGKGHHLNKYPFDNVVSFVFRHYPRNKQKHEVKILELGCGAGNNLWFAAREGFDVTGIDGSTSAIEFAKKRFQDEGLKGEFIIGDFTKLPFGNEVFDIVFDRGSLVCVNKEGAKKTIAEVRRVLKNSGKFFLNLYSDKHSSAFSGELLPDGFTTNITDGTLKGVGNLCFYGRNEILELVDDHWKILGIKHKSFEEIVEARLLVHAEWEIVLMKKDI